MTINSEKSYEAEIDTTKGVMKFELFSKETPKTVNNFVFLAKEGFYENTFFHRIIKSFMIQGGDPKGDGTGGPGYKFNDELITRDYERGVIAMANSGSNTNGSQFFIMHEKNDLQKNYVIFGKITEGLDILDNIASVPVANNGNGEESLPLEKVYINKITISEK
ncbi:MAG: peptidylprolyl isomerase [Candidatus Liptonbacteria bacterium RIFOXYC1_FULL_36_8]|uniref:Peptidyl-prolyl cis-trans isomerase n=2 Tax=Candidatus Liptoniibacteriota TaxID=1817909 RepID=A0A1G2CR66_9BACT|nr:MAG: peptidylprolyl isomerase [Candidatus Liptonbacteria bacterium RIFOXYB1_FULL_36_10]OGZ04363.1 MAG: peptidylprolyl isomerase [Candidatus Liptonbacteria bacterium RIFOXYC1_FULL_36_8]